MIGIGGIGGCGKLGYVFSRKQYNKRNRGGGKTIFIICLELQRGQEKERKKKKWNYIKYREIYGNKNKSYIGDISGNEN